jgi:hypothetical protein
MLLATDSVTQKSSGHVMRVKITALSLALVVSGVLASPASANLLTNGSFETTTNFVGNADNTMVLSPGSIAMTGWTISSNDLAWIGPANPFGLSASNGSYFLDLTSYSDSGIYGGVTQDIATVLGDSYSLTFDLGGSTLYGVPDSLTACAGATCSPFLVTSTGTNDWVTETLNFTGTGNPMAISLTGLAGANYIGLDNISITDLAVTPLTGVPEPLTMSIFGAGLIGTAALRRRKKTKAA